jgi:hypothetical protein
MVQLPTDSAFTVRIEFDCGGREGRWHMLSLGRDLAGFRFFWWGGRHDVTE